MRITYPSFVAALLFVALELAAQAPSPFIHVDQFGYLPGAEKVAVLSDPQIGYNSGLSFTPGATLEVRDANTDALVFSGVPVAYAGGATHQQSGDRGWWFDFTSVTAPGSYVVVDPASGERSAPFDVNGQVYDQVMYHALRMFYYNRANTAKPTPFAAPNWTDAASFTNPGQDTEARYIDDPTNPALYRDLTGGWFDAGDYNKYVTFAELPVHDLLSAYEDDPQAFTASSNIPGSSNGLPDILDEVKWELDWLLKMTNADGSVHIKMGNISYAQNTNSPPSNNFDPRYYGPTCTAAALANAGMFAHAAQVLQSQPGMQAYATMLESTAEACFNWALPHIQAGTLMTNCDDGRINAGDADRTPAEQLQSAVVAAWYLQQLTGNAAYTTFLDTYIPQVEPYASYYWSPYSSHLNTALLAYMAESTSNQAIVSYLTQTLQSTIDGQEFFGWDNRDLFRAHIPSWAYHWGSNQPKARMAFFNLQAQRAGFVHGGGQSLTRRAAEMLHYFHGVNPMGIVMLSNMYGAGAEHSVNEIYHLWFYDGTPYENALTSTLGPAPGYVTGGPNASYASIPAHDPNLIPPVGQPEQKSYLDDNDASQPGGGDNAIYAINEPAIYYQSAFVRLLASYVGTLAPLPVELLSFSASLAGDEVLIDWTVGAEINVADYIVERSADGAVFSDIASVAPQGAGAMYQYSDAAPLAGTSYYRLRIVDEDGSVAHSGIEVINRSAGAEVVAPFGKTYLFPNPAQSQTRIHLARVPQGARLELIDATGRVLISQSAINPSSQILQNISLPLDTSNLPAGVYAVKLYAEGGETTLVLKVME